MWPPLATRELPLHEIKEFCSGEKGVRVSLVKYGKYVVAVEFILN